MGSAVTSSVRHRRRTPTIHRGSAQRTISAGNWFGQGLLTRPSSATAGLPFPNRRRVTWRPPVGRAAGSGDRRRTKIRVGPAGASHSQGNEPTLHNGSGNLSLACFSIMIKNSECRDQSASALLDSCSGLRIPFLPPLRGKTSLMITARRAADSSHMLSHAVPRGFLDLFFEAERPGSTDWTSLFRD